MAMADTEPVSYCCACGQPIDPRDPDARVVERPFNAPGFQQQGHDIGWAAAGVIHPWCEPPRATGCAATSPAPRSNLAMPSGPRGHPIEGGKGWRSDSSSGFRRYRLRLMDEPKIVLTIPGDRVDLTRKGARWLVEHLPRGAVLRKELRSASEQDVQGAYIDIVEVGALERDAVKQAILGARGRAEIVPDDVSALERIL
jgi:hypothetical protein